jgi:LuxR family maltose regulon positive regulatory protein
VLRPRVIDRITRAASHAVTVIAAPAGYGKSVALEQYLATLETPYRFCDLAHDRFDCTIERAKGTIALDCLERAPGSTIDAIVEIIEQTRDRVHWIIATRSMEGLPMGTWLARHDCELPIGSAELLFSLDEVVDAAAAAGIDLNGEDARELASFTEGWPVALSIAIRALKHVADRREGWTTVREGITSYLDEQVYPTLNASQRELLAVAAALPQIEVDILESAGFADALHELDAIRRRTGLLQEADGQAFSLSGLVRDYLRRCTALAGAQWRVSINGRAACALESAGRMEGALAAYCTARLQPDVLRILERSGFELLERGRVACVSQAVDALDEATRRTNPRILALRGVLQALAGKPIRAETLLRRSLTHAKGDRDLEAAVTFRLALLLTNRGVEVSELLLPIASDEHQSASRRSEALSLVAARCALGGRVTESRDVMRKAEDLLSAIETDSVRAKVLQRLGVAAAYVGREQQARSMLSDAAEIATELEMYSLASRAFANLSNLMLHSFDDVEWQLWYAQQASLAAVKAGDAFDLETSLLQLLDAELRCGNVEQSAEIEERLSGARSGDQSRMHYLVPSKALRFAWDGRFAEAHRTLAVSWSKLHHDMDRLVSGAECALFLAMDKKRAESTALTKKMISLASVIEVKGPFARRSLGMALICCALAEALNGRRAHAERISASIGKGSDDSVVLLMSTISAEIVSEIRSSEAPIVSKGAPLLERLAPLGYAHLARLLESVLKALAEEQRGRRTDQLTAAERVTIRLLAEGLSPKEIALRRRCSVNTVRTHITNVISKLRCNGRIQAIAASRRAGILD